MIPSNEDENSQISLDNEFFKRMLDLVPATFYFDDVAKEKLSKHNAPDPDAVKNVIKKPGMKRGNEELSDKAKAKRAKFDPDQMQTVTRVQGILNEQDNTEKETKTKKKKKRKIGGDGDDSNMDVMRSSLEKMDDLHKRLQTKIDSMRAKRVGLKRKDAVEAKRMKRRESKMKLKLKRQDEKRNAMATKKDGNHKGNAVTSLVNGETRPRHASPPPGKTIFNKEGKIVFSKFDFSEKKSKKSDGAANKNYKQILEKVQKDKKDLKDLKATGDFETAHSIESKAAWKKALLQAEGVKVKDNPELLKKSIKRKEKIKKKSEREWDDRKEKVDKRMKERQDKRQKNIKSKKQARVDNKIKKAKKKGRILPGF